MDRRTVRGNRGRVPAKGGIAGPPPPVLLAITNPADLATVTAGIPTTVDGTSPSVATVNVTANAAAVGSSPVVGNIWSVPWTPAGTGPVTLAASDGTLSASISVTVVSGVAFAFTNPVNLATIPAGAAVTVSGTSPGSAPVTVTANAVAIGSSPVVGGVWSFSWTPLASGPTTLAATDGTLNAVISITVLPQSPAGVQFAGVTLIGSWRADLGVTLSTGMTAWANQGGPAPSWLQAGGAALEPTFSASGGPNSRPYIAGDGTARYCGLAYNPPAPATTSIFMWLIARLDAWVSGRQIIGGNANRTAIQAQVATPQIALRDLTAPGPTTPMTVGTWFRLYGLFTGSVSDLLKCGNAAAVSGINVGNTDSSSLALFASISGTVPCAVSVAEVAIATGGIPSNIAALDASYVTPHYGASVQV